MDFDWLIEISNIFFPEIMHIFERIHLLHGRTFYTDFVCVWQSEKHKKKTKMAFTHVRDQFNINTYVKMFLKIKSSHETNPPSYERKVTWNVTCMILSTEVKWHPLQCSWTYDPIEKCIKSFSETKCTNLHWT